MYPRVSQPSFGAVPPPGRASSYQQTSAPSSSRKSPRFCRSFSRFLERVRENKSFFFGSRVSGCFSCQSAPPSVIFHFFFHKKCEK